MASMLDEYKPSMEAKGIRYSYTPAALHALVVKSQGGKFGARDLRRVIRKAVEEKQSEITAYVVKGSELKEFKLGLGAMTDDEREIILKGCLINYYRG